MRAVGPEPCPEPRSPKSVWEGAFVFLLSPYGVTDAHAVAVSFLVFATLHMVPGILGGLIEAWRLLGPKW